MNHNKLVITETAQLIDPELGTIPPSPTTEVLWEGPGIPTDNEWSAIVEKLENRGQTVSDLDRQERRFVRIGGISLPLGWRDGAPRTELSRHIPADSTADQI